MEPQPNSCVGDRAVFEWQYRRLNDVRGPNGEYFALNIWNNENKIIRSVSWLKEPRFEVEKISDPIAVYDDLVNCNQDAGCKWSVDAILSHVAEGQGYNSDSFTILASSDEIRHVCVNASSGEQNPPQERKTPTPIP